MNLSTLKPGQLECATTFDRPLSVSAGAGSGKTYTLATRIVYAFMPESGNGTPVLDDINRVCAITYTSAAAGELKSRVKELLRQQGLSEQALLADNAWFSTIHGMCLRILRANALVLGIDPEADILMNQDYDALFNRALDIVLGSEDGEGGLSGLGLTDADELLQDPAVPREVALWAAADSPKETADLLAEFGFGGLKSAVVALMTQAKRTGCGFDGVDFVNRLTHPVVYVTSLLRAYQDLAEVLAGVAKPTEAQQRNAARAFEAVDALQGLADRIGGMDADRALALVLDVLGALEAPGAQTAAAVKPYVRAVQAEFARLGLGVRILQAGPLIEPLIAVTRRVMAVFEVLKIRAHVLDPDDLILKTLAAFKTHPEIAAAYENRFRLVMVDEFQDTNQTQLDLIKYLAGPNLERLCTVGDAQQSIYRFQGADVSVSLNHGEEVRRLGGAVPRLDVNFRSHGDILSFVEQVFSAEDVFGENFLHLEPRTDRPSRWPHGEPRVTLLHTLQAGQPIASVRLAEARAIAECFANLVGKPCGDESRALRQKDMVLLLRTMKNADLYAAALRERGLKCVIAGGSVFASLPEVRVMSSLAGVLRNPLDDFALYQVLAGPLFCVPDRELLLLTRVRREDGSFGTCALHEGLFGLLDREAWNGVSPEEVPFAAFAARVLSRGFASGQRNLSNLMAQVVTDSGWLGRLQAQGAPGTARAANVLKAIRLAEEKQRQTPGSLADAAARFRTALAGTCKEAPGALSGAEDDFIRIMTVHASKGLEYPVVAVAETEQRDRGSDNPVWNKVGPYEFRDALLAGETFNRELERKTLRESYGACKPKTLKTLRGLEPLGACREDAATVSVGLDRSAEEEESAEGLRLLYVALTRAREAVILAVRSKQTSGEIAPRPVSGCVARALFADGVFPGEDCRVDFGGSEPAVFANLVPVAPETEEAAGESLCEPALFEAAPVRVPAAGEKMLPPSLHQGVFSYSSLAAAAHGEDRPCGAPEQGGRTDVVAADAGGEEEAGARDAAFADREKATAFGSAFHLCAQFAVETGTRPDPGRVRTLAAACGVPDEPGDKGLSALSAALDRWFGGSAYAFAAGKAFAWAEVPFFIEVAGGYLEGSIDLLCADRPVGPGVPAVLFDYKTGGSPAETQEVLYEKHLLQAQCYAFALLKQGCSRVDAHFVRVQRDSAGLPTPGPYGAPAAFGDAATVDYAFTAKDLPDLERVIQEAKAVWSAAATAE